MNVQILAGNFGLAPERRLIPVDRNIIEVLGRKAVRHVLERFPVVFLGKSRALELFDSFVILPVLLKQLSQFQLLPDVVRVRSDILREHGHRIGDLAHRLVEFTGFIEL